MTIAHKPAKQHTYRLSAYERNENDFYPTPSDLATSLPFGLSQLGLDLPRVALDPCGGDGGPSACLWIYSGGRGGGGRTGPLQPASEGGRADRADPATYLCRVLLVHVEKVRHRRTN
jgi:hypothetical protein